MVSSLLIAAIFFGLQSCVEAAAVKLDSGSSSFTVPHVSSGKTVMRNPVVERYRMYRKHNMTAPAALEAEALAILASRQTGGSRRRSSGSVAASPEFEATLYHCPVTIGNQEFSMDFDSGSTDLWVMGKSEERSGPAFDPSQSPTWDLLEGYTFNEGFVDGSSASGIVGRETVTIAGLTLEHQPVAVAYNATERFRSDVENDGIVGLGFADGSTVRPAVAQSFFFSIKDSLDAPVLGVSLKTGADGTYDFGYIDHSKYTGDISYMTVDSATNTWQFELGGDKKVIADTGSTYIIAYEKEVNAYFHHVKGAVNDPVYGWTFPCEPTPSNFPLPMANGKTALIPGELVSFGEHRMAADGTQMCLSAVQSVPEGAGQVAIYGDVMFRSLYVVFDGTTGAERIGWANPATA